MGKNKGTEEGKDTRGFLERLSEWCKKHWFAYTLIIALPSFFIGIVLPYWGIQLGLTANTNDGVILTSLGIITTSVIIVIVALLVFLNNYYLSKTQKSNVEKLEGEVQYRSEIIQNMDRICQEKFSSLKNTIVNEKKLGKEKATIISNPSNQLKRIIDGITECLVKLLDSNDNKFGFKDLLVTITYRFPQEDDREWKWVEGGGEKDMELVDLLAPGCKSTFNYLLENGDKATYYFNNSKEDARAQHKYVFTPQDTTSEKQNEIVGSIYCSRYKVQMGGTVFVDAMISITTQKKRFSSQDKVRIVRENMHSLINDNFGKRIGIELSLLYLEYLKNQEIYNSTNPKDTD